MQVAFDKYIVSMPEGSISREDVSLWAPATPATPEAEGEELEAATEGGKGGEGDPTEAGEEGAEESAVPPAEDTDATSGGDDAPPPSAAEGEATDDVASDEADVADPPAGPPKAAPLAAKARVFKVYKAGHAVEFLDSEMFEKVVKRAESRGDNHITEASLENEDTSDAITCHMFLCENRESVQAVPLASSSAKEGKVPRALQTLTVPSAFHFAEVGMNRVLLPMISALPPDKGVAEDDFKTVLVRQIQEYPTFTSEEVGAMDSVMGDMQGFNAANEETSPNTYMVSEVPALNQTAKKLQEEISSIAQRIKELKEGSADVDHYEGRNGQSQSALADVAGATAASAPIALEVQ